LLGLLLWLLLLLLLWLLGDGVGGNVIVGRDVTSIN
jgi:hypothetical protein